MIFRAQRWFSFLFFLSTSRWRKIILLLCLPLLLFISRMQLGSSALSKCPSVQIFTAHYTGALIGLRLVHIHISVLHINHLWAPILMDLVNSNWFISLRTLVAAEDTHRLEKFDLQTRTAAFHKLLSKTLCYFLNSRSRQKLHEKWKHQLMALSFSFPLPWGYEGLYVP